MKLRVGITALYGQIIGQRCDKGMLPPDQPFCARLAMIATARPKAPA